MRCVLEHVLPGQELIPLGVQPDVIGTDLIEVAAVKP